MKRCNRCGETKPAEQEFYKNVGSKDGRLGICRACVAARQKDYVANNREKVAAGMRDYTLRHRDRLLEQNRAYHAKHKQRLLDLKREQETGFSPSLFQATVLFQNGKCALCQRDFSMMPKQHMHADHCHDTHTPRGVLCQNCNTALGMLGDSVESIRRVLAYLENPPAQVMALIA